MIRARRRQAAGLGSSKERDKNSTNRLPVNAAGHPLTGAGLDTGTAVTAVGIGIGRVGMGVASVVAVGRTGVEETAGVAVGSTEVGVTVGVALARGRGMITQPSALPEFPKESQTRAVTSYLPAYAIEPSPILPSQENLPGRFEPV